MISIVDDAPIAAFDTDSIAAGDYTPATGNVISGAGTTNAGADTVGADGASVVGVVAGNSGASLDDAATVSTQINGLFGKLTLNADGSYSYVRNPGSAGGGSDVFTYTVKDGDGDLAHTTLTISLGDATPTVSIPAAGGADTTVYEKGLPVRGLESAGTGEMADGNAGNNSDASETTGGTINFTSKDGVSAITLGGHALTTVPQTFSDATGSLTAHYSYDAATGIGSIVYAYTLADNTSGDNTSASFAVVISDADGDAAPAGNLVISIVDDAPIAAFDTDSIAAGDYTPATGNVISGAGTTNAGADTVGADGASVVGVVAGNSGASLDDAATVSTQINGLFGKLTLNADGSYSYVRNPGSAGGGSDVFTYTVKDGDGDLAHTTLTISLGDATPTVSIPAAGGADTTVYEKGLPVRGLESAGTGEMADGNAGNNSDASETTGGTINFTSKDGVSAITLGGHALTTVPQTFSDATGSLTAHYSYDAATGIGSIVYAYTLADNTSGDNTSASFAVVISDADGDAAPAGNLVISIVDDAPIAAFDTDSIAAGDYTPATGNVISGAGTTNAGADTVGADGASVVGVVAGNSGASLDDAATVSTQINGLFGKLTLNADGSYSYVRNPGSAGGGSDVFTYTVKDGDGDLAHTTLTISLGDATPTVSIPAAGGADTTVYEKGLPVRGLESAGTGEMADGNAGNNSDASETTGGTINFTSKDGVSAITLGGHALTTVPQTFSDATGSLTAHYSYDAATGIGSIVYAYTLADNTSGDNTSASFAVVISDADGDAAPAGNLVISIVDDAPIAAFDTDSIAAGDYTPATGNVISGAGTTNAGADTVGADGASVVGVVAGNSGASLDDAATVSTQINGLFGKLTLNADGSYSYVRNPGSAGGGSDVFTYTVKDGDGDLAHTTLTISLGDATPTVSIPAAGGADTTVYEKGLPVRGLESAGTGEMADGNAGNNSDASETTGGTINFTSKDGVSAITLGGHALTTVPQTFSDATGSLTAHYSYDAATGIGSIVYAYTLADNTSGDNTSASFAVVISDADGDAAPAGNLVISIVDDAPIAAFDTDSIAAGDYTPATGNVISGAGTTNAGADTVGADGASVVGVVAGNSGASLDDAATVSTQINGLFGKLTLNADGSYSYVRNPGSAGGGSDVFTYTVKDGDGDLAHTTLTISLGDATPTVSIPAAGGADTTVYEKGLPVRGLESAGTGEMADGNAGNNSDASETTGGTINFTSKDGVSAITLGGHALTTVPQTFSDATGSLTAHYSYDAATGIGSIVYAYTLADNTSGDNTSASFAVVISDADGDAAPAGNLVISIVDDAPIAAFDTDSIAAGDYTPATGNVISGAGTTNAGADTVGADGASVVGVVAGNSGASLDDAATVSTQINGLFGKLTLNADGSYSYVRNPGSAGGGSDVFTYTVKDGDGDLAHTTLTISLGDATPTVSIPAAGGADTTVYEKGLPVRGLESAGTGEMADGNAGNNSDASETTGGTINFTSKDGVSAITLGGHALTTVPQTFSDATGSLTAHYSYDAATGIGSIVYAYTLADNTSGDNTSASFAVVISDADGDAARRATW